MGCGGVADFGHVPAILETEGLELAALFDPDPKQLEKVAAKGGDPKLFMRQDEFLQEPLDAVAITSPAGFHHANLMGAAEKGLHALCEKPLALEDAQAEEMIKVMRERDLMLFTGFCYRFSPVAKQLKAWKEEGLAGKVGLLRMVYVWNLHGQYMQNEAGEWVEAPHFTGRMREGGPLIDCGTHQIDLARWWTGSEVAEYHAEGAWLTDYKAPSHVFLHLRHENGMRSAIEVSYSYTHNSRDPREIFTYDLIGDGGVLHYDRDGWQLEARGAETHVGRGASEKNFHGMYEGLRDALTSGDPGDMPSGEDGLIATQLAHRATDEMIQRRKG
jgi:predicted dehydrogenase